MEPEGFYVSVALEADEEHAVADVEYRGTQVATVRATAAGPRVVTYEAGGMPLEGLIAALRYAHEQLGDRS